MAKIRLEVSWGYFCSFSTMKGTNGSTIAVRGATTLASTPVCRSTRWTVV
jgi:hypothetical protein